jgi:hypothetical protein
VKIANLELQQPRLAIPLVLTCLLAAVCTTFVPTADAQSCANPDFDVEAALQQAWLACDENAVYEIGAVAGDRAIPALRKLAAAEDWHDKHRRCATLGSTAVKALAKLGDSTALQQLVVALDAANGSASEVADMAFVGDDQAIAIMMAYFERHLSDPFPFNLGGLNGNDVPMHSSLWLIVGAISSDIGKRRLILDSPFNKPWSGNDEQMKHAWETWWQQHKGSRLSIAPYENVSDPYLRCVARKVDWGFYGAVLEIADVGGDEALSLVKKFPPDGNKYWIPLALAKLGDEQKRHQFLDEWSRSDGVLDIERVEYLGGKEAAGILMTQFDRVDEFADLKAREREQCIAALIKKKRLKPGKKTDKYIQKSYCQQEYQGWPQVVQFDRARLMRALGSMVKNSPLSPDASPTLENIQRWKDWWAKNADSAQFVSVSSEVFSPANGNANVWERD